jgi:hypothetical protein
MKSRIIKSLAVAVVAAVSSTGALAGDDKTRLQCYADTADGIASMKARYETREGRRSRERFQASFETAPGFGLVAGNVLQVNVGGSVVGLLRLAVQANGDLGAEMDFDTNIDTDAPDTSVPFPANWPGVAPGTVVTVGTLGCSLQR